MEVAMVGYHSPPVPPLKMGVIKEQAGKESGDTGEIEDVCEGWMSLSGSRELWGIAAETTESIVSLSLEEVTPLARYGLWVKTG
jgi:hypothetical protein